MPLFLGEFHPLPIIVTSGVLEAELDTPAFRRGGFACRQMGLKLDGVGARVGNGVDVCVRHAQAAVMRLRHLPYNEASIGRKIGIHKSNHG